MPEFRGYLHPLVLCAVDSSGVWPLDRSMLMSCICKGSAPYCNETVSMDFDARKGEAAGSQSC